MNFPSIDDRYKITEQIGRGGMGRVYKAFDIRMGREVAIKFLNVAFLNDTTVIQRFKREVETLANLRHTAIVPLYNYGGLDSPSQSNPPYIVMRLMNQSLTDVLIQGAPMSFTAAVHITERIAGALDFTHQRGLVHRDLKPQNIFLDQQNYSYLGDFGIAHETMGETLTANAIIGTPHYMSPEQISAEPIDGRSDIYSLGCVLFQLLTGEKPFSYMGAGPAVFQAHHYAKRPSINAEQMGLPPEINEIIHKAMAVNREERYATAGDLVADLKRASATPSASINYPPPPFYAADVILKNEAFKQKQLDDLALPSADKAPQPKKLTLIQWIFLVAVVLGVIFAFSLFRTRPPSAVQENIEAIPGTNAEIPLAEPAQAITVAPAISTPDPQSSAEDGSVCRSAAGSETFINVIQASPRAEYEHYGDITLIDFGLIPFCSTEPFIINSTRDLLDFRHNGTRYVMGRYAQSAVFKGQVSLIDGDFLIGSNQLAEHVNLADHIQVSLENGILGIRISEQDQKVQLDCLADRCEVRNGEAVILDLVNNEGVLAYIDQIDANTAIRTADTGDYVDLASSNLLANATAELPDPALPTPIADEDKPVEGNLIYACTIDGIDQLCRLDFSTDQVTQLTTSGAASIDPSLDKSGSQIIFSSNRDGAWRLYQADDAGGEQTLIGGRKVNTFSPDLSPDGEKLVFAITDPPFSHIWTYDFTIGLHSQITEGEHINQNPSWSADGSKILFVSDLAGENRIYLINPDGSGLNEITFYVDKIGDHSDLSPNGESIVFFAGEDGRRNIYLGAIADGAIRQLTTSGDNVSPSFSPDGEWVVFSGVRERAKDRELYIIRIDGNDLTKVTENDINDSQPQWGP